MYLVDKLSLGVKRVMQTYFSHLQPYTPSLFHSNEEENSSLHTINYEEQQRKMQAFCDNLDLLVQRMIEEHKKKV